MAHYSEYGFSPIQSPIEFLNMVGEGKFSQLTPDDMVNGLIPWKMDKYTLRDFRGYFDEILELMGEGWDTFQHNFSSLDIACGAKDSEGFYPWWPAILAKLGADSYGIDLGNQPDQLAGMYHHTVFDLTQIPESGLKGIRGIAGKQFNLITFLNTINPYVPSDVMRRTASQNGTTLSRVQDSILHNIGDIMKENAILYMDTQQGWQQAYRKMDGELVQVK
jgi:hypothetical protein